MCGRFALYSTEDTIVSHFRLRQGFAMRARYNIAPSQTIPVITAEGVLFSRWGYIPSWAKTTDEGILSGFINARFETLTEKVAFKKAYQYQRCLFPANGYYEWREIAGKKQPFYIYCASAPLIALAGIWSLWRTPQGESIITAAIITAPAAPFLQPIHARAPVIVKPSHYTQWLLQKPVDFSLSTIAMDLDPSALRAHAVSSRMNHPQFDALECIRSLNG